MDISNDYLEIKRRFNEQGIDINNKTILISGRSQTLNGFNVRGIKFSEDERWVCIPVETDEFVNCTDSIVYVPQCFEVVEQYECFVGKGILSRTQVWILR